MSFFLFIIYRRVPFEIDQICGLAFLSSHCRSCSYRRVMFENIPLTIHWMHIQIKTMTQLSQQELAPNSRSALFIGSSNPILAFVSRPSRFSIATCRQRNLLQTAFKILHVELWTIKQTGAYSFQWGWSEMGISGIFGSDHDRIHCLLLFAWVFFICCSSFFFFRRSDNFYLGQKQLGFEVMVHACIYDC